MKQQDIQGVILIGGLAAAGYVLWKASQGISTATQGAGAGIATAATGAGKGISQASQGLGGAISGVSSTVDRTLRQTAETATDVLSDITAPSDIVKEASRAGSRAIREASDASSSRSKSRSLRSQSNEDFKTTTTQAANAANTREETQRKTEYGSTVGQFLAKTFTPTAEVGAERRAALRKTVSSGVEKVKTVLAAPVKAAESLAQKAGGSIRSAVGSITSKLASWF